MRRPRDRSKVPHQDQPPNRPFIIGVGAKHLCHIPDRRSLGLDLPAFSGFADRVRSPRPFCGAGTSWLCCSQWSATPTAL
jgi:hypothetical protein